MTPYEQGARLVIANANGWAFKDILEAHAFRGLVVISPTLFVLARPIMHDWPESRVNDPHDVAEEPDCWHVWAMAGKPREALSFASLPWISWHRRGVRRIHRWQ